MLEKLHIKNFALIDELEIRFKAGLNVLTGETGAGKSIIFEAINFVLGEKADKDQIKTGTDAAEVTAVFSVEDEFVISRLAESDVRPDDEKCVLLERSFNTDGKSNCKINGKTVTVGMLKEVGEYLVDIHGQYDHQSLLKNDSQLVLLDRLCGDKVAENLEKIKERYKGFKETLKMLEDMNCDDADREAKIDLYKFQINEIKMADLKPNEEEELNEKRDIIANGVKLKKFSDEALDILYRNESNSASDKIAQALETVGNITKVDATQASVEESLEGIAAQLEGVIEKLRNYSDTIESDPRELDEIEIRLQLIYELKKKYGSTIEEVNAFVDKAEEKLAFIENSAELLMEYQIRKEADERIINKLADEVSEVRHSEASMLGKQIEDVLYDLGMINAVFNVSVTPADSLNERGKDKVEFLISANLGEEPKPLNKIASGGEMSRVMLALKVILADVDKIGTFIFDEIDTGISGRTAQRVAEKMTKLAKSHQILCITHLPQIAAMADNHYLIDKVSGDNGTTTLVTELNESEIEDELARLIGGARITDATLSAARDMKNMANKFKA
jgi:DNA repair protein RecN (Recombination protein N)